MITIGEILRRGLFGLLTAAQRALLRLTVLLAASAFSLSGCLPPLLQEGAGEGQDARPLEPLALPLWSALNSSSLPASSEHLGEVLATREITRTALEVVSAGADGNVIVWNLATGAGRLVMQVGGPMQVAALGRRHAVVAWSSAHTVSVACLAGCSDRWTLTRLKTRTTSLGFHEDDAALLIGGADGRVYRWLFPKEGQEQSFDERDRSLERYIAHQTLVSVVAPLHTGRAFFSADWDGQLYGWLTYSADDHQGSFDRNLFGGRFFGGLGNYMSSARPADRGITALTLSENGQRLALGTDDGYVEVWEVRGFEITSRTLTHVGRVISVALSNDGSRVASLGRDGAIVAADIVTDPTFGVRAGALRNSATQVFKEEMKSARSIYFLSTGDLLLSTQTGQLGALALAATPRVPAPKPLRITPGAATTEKGSDY